MEIRIEKFNRQHFQEVNRLSMTNLVRELNADELLAPGVFCFVALEDDKVVGFSIGKIVTLEKLFTDYPKLQRIFQINLKNPFIGMLQSIVVHKDYRGQGIANSLTTPRMEIFDALHMDIIAVVWKKKEGTPGAWAAKKRGLKKIAEIEKMWENHSRFSDITCIECSKCPCECAAEIYLRKYDESISLR